MTPEQNPLDDLLAENLTQVQVPLVAIRQRAAKDIKQAKQKRNLGAAALLGILLAASLLAFTPQGRAFAQQVIDYFSRTPSDTVALSEARATQANVDLKNETDLNQIESIVGYKILKPAILPEGYHYFSTVYAKENGLVWQFYTQGYFRFMQVRREVDVSRIFFAQVPGGPEGFLGDSLVGASAKLKEERIGGVQVQTARGVWKYDGADQLSWIENSENGSTYNTNIWQKDGFSYLLGYQFFGEKLNEDAQILSDQTVRELVETFLTGRKELSVPWQVNGLERPLELEKRAGFTTLLPDRSPLGFFPDGVSFDEQTSEILFQFLSNGAVYTSPTVTLTIREKQVDAAYESDLLATPTDKLTQVVPVGTAKGIFRMSNESGSVVETSLEYVKEGISIKIELNGALMEKRIPKIVLLNLKKIASTLQ